MSSLFGTQYFGFIASAYGVTTVVLLVLTASILLTYSKRKKALLKLEQAGLKRASRKND